MESKIIFDDSSLTKIFTSPSSILQDVESFWDKEEAYINVKSWHTASGTPFSYEKFISSLKEFQEKGVSNNEIKRVLEIRNKILDESTFKEKILRHLKSFLPKWASPFEVKISFVGYVEPVAFTRPKNIMLNITNAYWADKSVGFILNILLHELYHIAFHNCIEIHEVNPRESKEKLVEHVYWWLHNEGIATYVSYSGQNLFPFHDFVPDYGMIDNTSDVDKSIKIVNNILARCKEESYENIANIIWGKGIRERAFYTVGGFMSKRIDQELGREALINTIGKSPKCFVETFNQLAFNETKIIT